MVPYFKALKKEVLFYKSLLRERAVKTVYFGGGTPSLIQPEFVRDFLFFLMSEFQLVKQPEITIEANPESVTETKLEKWLSAGINRLSLGFQSLNQSHLQTLGRLHSVKKSLEAYQLARLAGFKNINIDLIFGIPGETYGDWTGTLLKAVSLNPDHLSVYALTLKPGSRLLQGIKEERKLEGFDEASQADKYIFSLIYLKKQGFNHYEISNFARSGFECQHNLTYWQRGDYLGLGCSAASMANNCRWSNYASFKKYLGKVFQGKKPVRETQALTFQSALKEKIFLGMRLVRGIRLKEVIDSLREDQQEKFQMEIANLREAGFLEVENGRVFLSPKGLLLSNQVFVRLMQSIES